MVGSVIQATRTVKFEDGIASPRNSLMKSNPRLIRLLENATEKISYKSKRVKNAIKAKNYQLSLLKALETLKRT